MPIAARLIAATEVLSYGSLTWRDLARSYIKVHRNVYARADIELTATDRAHAAWLWSGRCAMLEFLAAKGWAIVRVSATQLRSQPAVVVSRVRTALQRAGFH